jgi:hypothetical protein
MTPTPTTDSAVSPVRELSDDTCEQAASDALDFVMTKLPAIKKEKGLVGVWMNAWRLAWTASAALSRRSLDNAGGVEPFGWWMTDNASEAFMTFERDPEKRRVVRSRLRGGWIETPLFASRTPNTEMVVKGERKELEAAADAALQALEDWHHVNIAEFTGWGDGEVPQGAEDNLQAVKNARAALATPPSPADVTGRGGARCVESLRG